MGWSDGDLCLVIGRWSAMDDRAFQWPSAAGIEVFSWAVIGRALVLCARACACVCACACACACAC
eukprot:5466318-Alexandrium_andersonii.AAC.1